MSDDAKVCNLPDSLDALLATLEKDGIANFYAPAHWPLHPQIERLWQQFGIEGGTSATLNQPATIQVLPPSPGGLADVAPCIRLVHEAAARQDNIRKVARADS